MLEIDTIYCSDCLTLMKSIEDKSIDCILCDLPYGMTACEWDVRIPFEPLWEAYKRIIKPNGAIVLTGSQPFTSELVCSNLKWFKYEWVWEKSVGGFLNCNFSPLKRHENILIFGNGVVKYNPQKTKGDYYTCRRTSAGKFIGDKDGKLSGWITDNNGDRFPVSIIRIPNDTKLHPTQKPVALFEYLIRTYTNEGDLVLDNCAGSCTTAVAAIKNNRHYICIEMFEKYCIIGQQRVDAENAQLKLDFNGV